MSATMLTALVATVLQASDPAAAMAAELAEVRSLQGQALAASRDLLVDSLPFGPEKLRLRDIKIEVVSAGPYFAASTSDGKILVASNLLIRLAQMIALWEMEGQLKTSALEERFLRHEVDAFAYADHTLVPLERFAGMTEAQRPAWRAAQPKLLRYTEWAGTFLLAHELGHHALGEFSRVSQAGGNQELEYRVDRWAIDAMKGTGIPPFFGVTWLLLYLATDGDYQLEFGDPAAMSHDLPHARARNLLLYAAKVSVDLYRQAPWNATPLASWQDAERRMIAIFDEQVRERERKTPRYFQLLADGGDIDALMKLGYMHATGTQVPRDPAKGLLYRRTAAALGDAFAQVKVGEAWLDDRQPLRSAQGLYWWRRAADQRFLLAEDRYPQARASRARTAETRRALCIHDEFERRFAPDWNRCLADRREACLKECTQVHGRAPEDCRDFLCPSRDSKRAHFGQCSLRFADPQRMTTLWAAAEAACP